MNFIKNTFKIDDEVKKRRVKIVITSLIIILLVTIIFLNITYKSSGKYVILDINKKSIDNVLDKNLIPFSNSGLNSQCIL